MKRERVAEILRRIAAAPPAATAEGALALVGDVTNGVEDEMSGLPYDAKAATTMARSPRMYPPLPDSQIPTMIVGVLRYQTVGHSISVGLNGAIEISDQRSGAVVLSKVGADGNGVPK